MTRTTVHLGLILAASVVSAAAVGDEVEQELLELERQIAQAIVQGDVPFVERVWAEDFFYTGVRGETKSKSDIVAELSAGRLKFELLQFDDQRIGVYGDTALVTGRATTRGRSPEGEISGRFRYTRVYLRRDGQWRLVAFQGTALAEENRRPRQP